MTWSQPSQGGQGQGQGQDELDLYLHLTPSQDETSKDDQTDQPDCTVETTTNEPRDTFKCKDFYYL